MMRRIIYPIKFSKQKELKGKNWQEIHRGNSASITLNRDEPKPARTGNCLSNILHYAMGQKCISAIMLLPNSSEQ